MAEQEGTRLLRQLPPEFRREIEGIPITHEIWPSDGLVADGVAPDTLGLFVGAEYGAELLDPLPAQIILFIGNLWDESEGDPQRFREEVRTTLLHEMGHYLGLDEGDLQLRDLD